MEVRVLFHNLLEDGALAGTHPTTHEEEHWAPLTEGHRHHHLCATTRSRHPYGFHLLQQCMEHPLHFQVLRHLLKPLFPVNNPYKER